MKVMLNALVWKEFLEGRRSAKILFILVPLAIYLSIQPLFGSYKELTSEDLNSFKLILLNQMMFVPIMIIPMIGLSIFSRSLLEERREKALSVLLAMGIPPQKIWFIKFSTALVISYASYVITLVLYLITSQILFSVTPDFNLRSIFLLLILFPIFATVLLSILAFTYWILRNPIIPTMVVVTTSISAVLFFSSYLQNAEIKISLLLIIGIISSAVIVLSAVILSKISNEYIANL